MEQQKKCECCGKEMIARHPSCRYCDECKLIRKQEQKREARLKRKAERDSHYGLDKVAAMARERGISYGQMRAILDKDKLDAAYKKMMSRHFKRPLIKRMLRILYGVKNKMYKEQLARLLSVRVS